MGDYPKVYFYHKIVRAKLYIDVNFASNIDVNNIASEACFSKYDFIRQFAKTYDYTPYQYLKQVRMQQAAYLLETSELSIQDICFDVGYNSISSFSRMFRKTYNISPKQYQQKFKDRKLAIKKQPRHYIPNCFMQNAQ